MSEDAFINYVIECERLLEQHYGITLDDADLGLDEIDDAQQDGLSPVEFVHWFALKNYVPPVRDDVSREVSS